MTDPSIAQRRRVAAPTISRPARVTGEGAVDLEERGRQAAKDAMRLAGMVRDEEQPVIAEWLASLTRLDLESLAVAAAAMVPVDRPASELLAWIDFADRPAPTPQTPRLALVEAKARRARPTVAQQRLATGEKWCPQCASHRPLSAFYGDRSRPDGLSGWCRDCTSRRRRDGRAS